MRSLASRSFVIETRRCQTRHPLSNSTAGDFFSPSAARSRPPLHEGRWSLPLVDRAPARSDSLRGRLTPPRGTAAASAAELSSELRSSTSRRVASKASATLACGRGTPQVSQQRLQLETSQASAMRRVSWHAAHAGQREAAVNTAHALARRRRCPTDGEPAVPRPTTTLDVGIPKSEARV